MPGQARHSHSTAPFGATRQLCSQLDKSPYSAMGGKVLTGVPCLSHSRPHVPHAAVLAGWSGLPLSLYAPDSTGVSSMVKVRSRRMSRTKEGHQVGSVFLAAARLAV